MNITLEHEDALVGPKTYEIAVSGHALTVRVCSRIGAPAVTTREGEETMGRHNQGINSEDEWFARRAGERDRAREERARQEVAPDAAAPSPLAETQAPSAPEPTEGATTASRLVATMSTAMKALFGIRGRHRA